MMRSGNFNNNIVFVDRISTYCWNNISVFESNAFPSLVFKIGYDNMTGSVEE